MSNPRGGPRGRQHHTGGTTTTIALSDRGKHSCCPINWPTALSREELSSILDGAKSSPVSSDLQDVVILVVNTGIRTGELRDLRWENIDFVDRHLLVSSNSKKGRTRRVPFGPTVLCVLQARRIRQPQTEFVLGESPRTVVERVKRELRRFSAGARPITLRRLRYTFFTRWIYSGGSPAALALIVGWSSYDRFLHSQLTLQQRYEIAAVFQAKLDQEE